MDPRPIVIDRRAKGMRLSTYLTMLNPSRNGTEYNYGNLDVLGLVTKIRNWVVVNRANLPDLFLSPEEETPDLSERVSLPQTDLVGCPRNPNHSETALRTDEFGRVICDHTNFFQVYREEIIGTQVTYDFHALKPKAEVVLRKTPSTFDAAFNAYKASMEGKPRVIVADVCDAVVYDRRVSLEFAVRKINASHNDIMAYYGHGENRQNSVFSALQKDSIPLIINGLPLTGTRELISFPYDPKHIAFLAKSWWLQEPVGSAPVYREVESRGTPEKNS